jgi:hypothetical protein
MLLRKLLYYTYLFPRKDRPNTALVAPTHGHHTRAESAEHPRGMEHLEELNKFLLLAKTAKGAACAELIKQVLDSPSIFVFGELLAMPNVQEVRVLLRPTSCADKRHTRRARGAAPPPVPRHPPPRH